VEIQTCQNAAKLLTIVFCFDKNSIIFGKIQRKLLFL